MANYHLEIKNVSRGNGDSITRRTSYIFGEKLRDNYLGNNCYKTRSDVLFRNVFLPINAPPEYGDLQTLCDEIDKAEKRYDARTAKEFIGSLPNELPQSEIVKIVEDFVKTNFIENGFAVVAAIHEGHNDKDKNLNNPHVHILVTTRTLDTNGFDCKKARELDQKENVQKWREEWAIVQNRAYERNGLDIRVSHESLEVQGKKRKPTPHISVIDWQKEKKSERTRAGDNRRAIREQNKRQHREKDHEKPRARSR